MDIIGKVRIDDTYYPGEDFYCDGEIEDELLKIVEEYPSEQFYKVIEERGNWPIFYHLSTQRQNIVEWLPMDSSMKVLEVGSGCGAITGMLAQKAGEVHCVELSKKRTLINANRNKECDNVIIQIGNFKDIEPHLSNDYDYILLIGVFEYAQGYMGTESAYVDFLNMLKKHMKENGRLVIAIENQLGLKYWAGCREDHVGTYFTGLEGYQEQKGVRTFTRRGLEKILIENKVTAFEFYYPYPDYKFMTTLYSDMYLPKQGELRNNICNYDRERMLLFDESLVFDTIIQEERFPEFSNSYMVVIGPQIPIKYCKYSNERREDYAIRTDMICQRDGTFCVEKSPYTEKAKNHVQQLVESYELLTKRYEGSKIKFNHILSKGDVIRLEYVKGISLECMFDRYLQNKDFKGFLKLFQEYYKTISYNNGVEITNYDFIFSNVIVQNNQWIVIDYEWIKREIVDAKRIAYRGFYCYTLGTSYQIGDIEEQIRELLGITQEEVESVKEEEVFFQKSVTGSQLTKAEIGMKIGNRILTVDQMRPTMQGYEMAIQIYEDCGIGYQEETAYFQGFSTIGLNVVTVKVKENIRSLRIDPCMQDCIVEVLDVKWDGVSIIDFPKKIKTNGVSVGGSKFFFQTRDPMIEILLKRMVGKKRKDKSSSQLEIIYILSCIVEI